MELCMVKIFPNGKHFELKLLVNSKYHLITYECNRNIHMLPIEP